MTKIHLLCLPYAGGLSGFFGRWQKFTDESIHVVPLELAGRGTRSQEPFYQDFSAAIDDILSLVRDLVMDGPYAVFGHSMGAMLSYELYHRLAKCGLPLPVHMFFSGRRAIHEPGDGVIRHKLPDVELMQELLDFGGTVQEVFRNKQLRELFLPILRADFRLVETYEHVPRERKIDCDMTVLGGVDDATTTRANLTEWRRHAGRSFDLRLFAGGHFFLNDDFDRFMHAINDTLRRKIRSSLVA